MNIEYDRSFPIAKPTLPMKLRKGQLITTFPFVGVKLRTSAKGMVANSHVAPCHALLLAQAASAKVKCRAVVSWFH